MSPLFVPRAVSALLWRYQRRDVADGLCPGVGAAAAAAAAAAVGARAARVTLRRGSSLIVAPSVFCLAAAVCHVGGLGAGGGGTGPGAACGRGPSGTGSARGRGRSGPRSAFLFRRTPFPVPSLSLSVSSAVFGHLADCGTFCSWYVLFSKIWGWLCYVSGTISSGTRSAGARPRWGSQTSSWRRSRPPDSSGAAGQPRPYFWTVPPCFPFTPHISQDTHNGQDPPPLHDRRQMGHTREPRFVFWHSV